MYFRRKTSAGRAYLQIVESRRDGDQVRQQVIATLGRFEELQASGQLERLLRSGARFATKATAVPETRFRGRYQASLYNARRPHSSLDGTTPDQAYFNPLPLRLAA